jgi:2-polyprenyl-3-methyl-5-hydroxy-6-metoxy-1,4-benzoquinol methylase
VLEHVPKCHQRSLLVAISKAMNPNGTLFLTVPNADSSIASRWRYIDWTHEMSFTEASLAHLVRTSGLKVLQTGGASIYKVPTKKFRLFWNSFSLLCKLASRTIRRIELIGELGPTEGLQICIDVNLSLQAKVSHDS